MFFCPSSPQSLARFVRRYAPTGTGDVAQRGASPFPQTETEVGEKDIRSFPFSINSSSYIRRVLAAIELQEK